MYHLGLEKRSFSTYKNKKIPTKNQKNIVIIGQSQKAPVASLITTRVLDRHTHTHTHTHIYIYMHLIDETNKPGILEEIRDRD